MIPDVIRFLTRLRQVGAVWLLLALPAAAQEAAAAPGLEEGAGVEGMAEAPAQAGAPDAGAVTQLRGVVIFVSRERDYFHVMVGSRAKGFRVVAPLEVPGFGHEVEVDYREASALSGGWDALAIRSLGQGRRQRSAGAARDATHNSTLRPGLRQSRLTARLRTGAFSGAGWRPVPSVRP